MTRLAMALSFGTIVLLAAGPGDAQWRYTDDRGTARVTQYKIDVPTPYRDAAEWVGPVGIGKPALSADQHLAAQRWEAIQRIIAAEAAMLQIRTVPQTPLRADTGGPSQPMTTMCVAGELRAMTSPGSWKVIGPCSAGFSTNYGTNGYGTFGSVTVR